MYLYTYKILLCLIRDDLTELPAQRIKRRLKLKEKEVASHFLSALIEKYTILTRSGLCYRKCSPTKPFRENESNLDLLSDNHCLFRRRYLFL